MGVITDAHFLRFIRKLIHASERGPNFQRHFHGNDCVWYEQGASIQYFKLTWYIDQMEHSATRGNCGRYTLQSAINHLWDSSCGSRWTHTD